uniref:WAP domain-containing protein n=1 Tax=Cyprinus carpio TaxID=7962 RepID=A0A8C1PCI1_CYPCA
MCSCQSPHRCGYSLYLVITDSSIHLGIYDPNKTFHHILSSDFLTFNYSSCCGNSFENWLVMYFNCPNNQKCCSNGCGHQCMAPYKAKPGVCPRNNVKKMVLGVCAEMCSHDSDCPNEQKCCSNGGGHQCMAPYKGIYYIL